MSTQAGTPEMTSGESAAPRLVMELLRLAIGWTFLWAFLDKLFGLGFSTCRDGETGAIDVACDASFIKGGSATFGFLTFATENSHTGGLFSWMAPDSPTTQNLTDWGFMLGLAFIGITLTLGFMVRIGSMAGIAMFLFMYLAGYVWPSNNLFWDEHLLQALLCVGFIVGDAGRRVGIGGWWRGLDAVSNQPMLR